MRKQVLAIIVVAWLFCLGYTSSPIQSHIVANDEPITIVFDFSHGQRDYYGYDYDLKDLLETRGYNVVWANGGLNSTILENASALILGCVKYGYSYSTSEVTAVSEWFNQGGKFLWIGGDSDWNDHYIYNQEVYKILESVRSHVYPEQAHLKAKQNVVGNQAANVVANVTTQNSRFQSIVENITEVLMADGTTLYGSNHQYPNHELNPIDLETHNITDVYPILFYNPSSYVRDDFPPPMLVHSDFQEGAFVAVTLEDNAGCSGNGILVVSGTPIYGEYGATCWTDFFGEGTLDGPIFINQLIDFGVDTAIQYSTRPALTLCPQITTTTEITTTSPTTGPTLTNISTGADPILGSILVASIGTAVLLVIAFVVVKRGRIG
jgi:hypothetical protein